MGLRASQLFWRDVRLVEKLPLHIVFVVRYVVLISLFNVSLRLVEGLKRGPRPENKADARTWNRLEPAL